jgi:hypothetical protein
MLKKLNGWQRLWVVVLFVYLVPVALLTIDALPKASVYARTRLHESIDAAGKYMESVTPGYTYEGSYVVRDRYYKDLSDEQIIERLHTKFKDKINLAAIDDAYDAKLADLNFERAKVVGYALLWWLIPGVLLYALGSAIAWVAQGFRGESA